MKHIGIFGGTFDPIHRGHIELAEAVFDLFQLAQIRFIPCKAPVHKPDAIASTADRLKMLHIALDSHSSFIIDDREIKRDIPSYTVTTLRALKKDFPNDALYFIMGADSLHTLPTWHEWRELFDLAHLLVVGRAHHALEISPALEKDFRDRHTQSIEQIKASQAGYLYIYTPEKAWPFASSEIRKHLHQHLAVDGMLSPDVLKYIHQHGLYK